MTLKKRKKSNAGILLRFFLSIFCIISSTDIMQLCMRKGLAKQLFCRD